MNDIIISKTRIKKEINGIGIIFLFTVLLNIFSIIIYKTNWMELITQVPFMIILTIVFYFIYTFIRMTVMLAMRLFTHSG